MPAIIEFTKEYGFPPGGGELPHKGDGGARRIF